MAGRVLKSEQIELKESDMTAENKPTAAAVTAKPDAAGKLSAKIVDKTENFIVIEISCPCGQKAFLKCDYAKSQCPSE